MESCSSDSIWENGEPIHGANDTDKESLADKAHTIHWSAKLIKLIYQPNNRSIPRQFWQHYTENVTGPLSKNLSPPSFLDPSCSPLIIPWRPFIWRKWGKIAQIGCKRVTVTCARLCSWPLSRSIVFCRRLTSTPSLLIIMARLRQSIQKVFVDLQEVSGIIIDPLDFILRLGIARRFQWNYSIKICDVRFMNVERGLHQVLEIEHEVLPLIHCLLVPFRVLFFSEWGLWDAYINVFGSCCWWSDIRLWIFNRLIEVLSMIHTVYVLCLFVSDRVRFVEDLDLLHCYCSRVIIRRRPKDYLGRPSACQHFGWYNWLGWRYARIDLLDEKNGSHSNLLLLLTQKL